MAKGNQELRFRADENLHSMVENTQKEIGAAEKSAAAKLLIQLGHDQVNNAVSYLDNITHPLSERQFEEMFLTLKIRVKQKRLERKNIKKLGKNQ